MSARIRVRRAVESAFEGRAFVQLGVVDDRVAVIAPFPTRGSSPAGRTTRRQFTNGVASFLLWALNMDLPTSSIGTREDLVEGHRILACVDRSTHADGSVAAAISLARALDSHLTLVNVMQPRHEHAGPHTDVLDWEIARQEARAHLERLQQHAAQALGRPVAIRLEQGHAAERIVELGRELDANLTILGSHGEGGAVAWNLGSTVQQVVAVSRASVFIAHASATRSATSLRRIVVPLDGSRRTESALPTTARIARAYGAEVVLVHVVQDLLPTQVLRADEDLELARQLSSRLEISAQAYLEGLRAGLLREGVSVRTLVVRAHNQRHCILKTSKNEHADLIVVAAHGVGCDPARTFGSVTEYLLTHSSIPLLVLQDLPETELLTPSASQRIAPPLRASYPPECV